MSNITLVWFLGNLDKQLLDIILLIVVLTLYGLNLFTERKEFLHNYYNNNEQSLFKVIILILVGVTLLLSGSYLLINELIYLVKLKGISEIIISITIVTIEKSLPILFTFISAIRKNIVNLLIGSIIGSYILSISIFFLSNLINPIQNINRNIMNRDLPYMNGLTGVFVLLLSIGNLDTNIKKYLFPISSIAMFVSYIIFIYYLIYNLYM